MSDKMPRRRVVFELKLGADSVADLSIALARLAEDVGTEWSEDAVPPNGAAGGWASGYSYTASVDPSVTHESYFDAVKARKEGAA